MHQLLFTYFLQRVRLSVRHLALGVAGAGAAVFGVAFWLSGSLGPRPADTAPMAPSASYSPAHWTPAVSIADLRASECELAIQRVRAEPVLPGASAFEGSRLDILSRVKAEPLLFVAAPRYEARVHPPVLELRAELRKSHPYTALKKMRTHFSTFHEDARQLLLPEGYLWVESAEVAQAIATWIRPEHLFGHDEIWIQRGERVLHARRRADRSYVWLDGEHEGSSVQLMPLDRMGTGPVPETALHRDLRSLKDRLHFSAMRVVHSTASAIVAELKYEQWWVPSLLHSRGPRLELGCEVAHENLAQTLAELRVRAGERWRALQVMRQTILSQIDEALPFDEPRREYGLQLDGKLRSSWWAAYQRRQQLFNFGPDEYAVYDEWGRPHVPQVCVDFLMDTFERMSGTWYTPRAEHPERVQGKWDFSRVAEPEALRQVSTFMDFASGHQEWFETYEPPWSRRVRLGASSVFVSYLQELKSELQVGDMILIRGKTPWDPARMHYHSYIIYESDPLTGVPLYLAGNAGRPSIRVWQTEADRTPDRYIVFRIRPRSNWLLGLVPDAASPPQHPLSLGPSRG